MPYLPAIRTVSCLYGGDCSSHCSRLLALTAAQGLVMLGHVIFEGGGGYSLIGAAMRVMFIMIITFVLFCCAARGSVVVKTLCYKPEGHGFETR
jgi:hypothetical protein